MCVYVCVLGIMCRDMYVIIWKCVNLCMYVNGMYICNVLCMCMCMYLKVRVYVDVCMYYDMYICMCI